MAGPSGQQSSRSRPSAANSTAPSTTGTICRALSPASYTRQLYAEARMLPRHARAERRADLYLQFAALAAANAAEDAADDNNNDDEVEDSEEIA